MCSTCGCGTTDQLTIQRVDHLDGKKQHIHMNGHAHEHNHDHHHHHHHGDGHHHHNHGHKHDHHDHMPSIIEVERDILHKNDVMAARNRGFLEAKNIFALNLVSSPGSGKTSLLERTISDIKGHYPICVIEGDQQSQNDANRIAACEVPVVQVNTGKGCHLDADMVHHALRQLNPASDGFLFIENVGNLVCPSLFDLGENKRVVIISVTEGDDKPEKYPDMFHSSDICIVNKIDLLPYVQFDVEKMKQHALRVNPNLEFVELSATGGTGLEQWYDWLRAGLK